MSKAVKSLAVATFFMLVWSGAWSQNYPVQANLSIAPPYSVHLQDYVAPGMDKLALNLMLTDLSVADLQVKLKVSIEGQGIKIVTKPSWRPEPHIISGGVPERFVGYDLAEYFNPDHLDFQGMTKQKFIQTGALPEGVYRFCIEVQEYNRNVNVSNAACVTAWVILNDPPLINMPAHAEKLRATDPQNVIFQWTPRHTGSPNSAFTTEYDFRLVEIWPEGRNPDDAIRTSNSIYETTTQSTTLVYGIAEPALIPGRSYAFRVRAKSIVGIDEMDLFKNNGYSQTVMFTYGDECKAPLAFAGEGISSKRIKTSWESAFNHTEYSLRYREANRNGASWFEETTFLNDKVISSLKPDTKYEFQIKAGCGSIESEYSDVLAARTEIDRDDDFACGVPPDAFGLDNTAPLENLFKGDYIYANDFDIKIDEISGSNGVFSGTGLAEMPFLSLVKVRVIFEGIRVNTDYRMIGGRITSIYDPNSRMLVDLDEDDKITDGDGGTTTEDTDDYAFDGTEVTVEGEITDVTVDDDGNIVIETADGSTTVITPETDEETGEKKDTRITDSGGSSWTVDKDGNVSKDTGSDTDPNEPDAVSSDSEIDFIVKFVPNADQKYGFDQKDGVGEYDNVEIRGEEYWIAWKSVETGRQDVVNVTTEKEEFPDVVGFKTLSGELPSQPVSDASQKQVTVTGIVPGDGEVVTAYVKVQEEGEEEAEEVAVGQLKIATYNLENKKVFIVPVNDATAVDVAKQLNTIYSQAVAKWDVTIDKPFEISTEDLQGLDDGESGMLASFPQKMRKFNRKFKRSRNIDKDAYYIFLIGGKDASSRAGFMPFKRQFGYVFVDNTADEARTIAHELAHGAFRLRHTFSSEAFVAPRGSTDNLMDYNGGTVLRKYQWDFVHNSETMVGWFQEDEESASEGDPILDYILKKAQELNLSNEEVLAILHCKACSENDNLNEVKSIKNIDVELGDTAGKAFLFDAPKFKCISILYDEKASNISVGAISGENYNISDEGSSLKIKLVDESVLVCNDYLLDLDSYLDCSSAGQGDITTTYIDKLYKQVTLCLNGDQRDLSGYPVFFDFSYQQGDGFDAVIKQISDKLQVDFFSDVKMAVNLSNSYGREETLLTSGLGSADEADVSLGIHVDEVNGKAYLSIKASEGFLAEYVAARQQDANARGIEVDVEELRVQVIADLEALETHDLFSTFCQSVKSVFSESIGAFVEVVQTTQKASKTIWRDGQMDKGHWWSKAENNKKWPGYATMHPAIAGPVDGLIDEVTGIPIAIRSIYGIMTEEEQRESFKQLFTADGMSAMVGALGNELDATLKDTEKLTHTGGKTVINVAAIFLTGGISKTGKGLNMLENLLSNLGALKDYKKLTAYLGNLKQVTGNSLSVAEFDKITKAFDGVFKKFVDIPDAQIILQRIENLISRIGVENFSDFLLKLDKLKDIPGIEKVLKDLTVDPNGWSIYVGAKFVVDYVSKKGDDFITKITRFEEATDIIVDGVSRGRVYDMVADGIRYEFKNWNGFWPTSFKKQFLGDLANESFESLGQFKWIFNKTGEINNIETLQKKVLAALRKSDGKTPIDELSQLSLTRIRKLVGDDFGTITQANRTQKILEALEDSTFFKAIFEVAK